MAYVWRVPRPPLPGSTIPFTRRFAKNAAVADREFLYFGLARLGKLAQKIGHAE